MPGSGGTPRDQHPQTSHAQRTTHKVAGPIGSHGNAAAACAGYYQSLHAARLHRDQHHRHLHHRCRCLHHPHRRHRSPHSRHHPHLPRHPLRLLHRLHRRPHRPLHHPCPPVAFVVGARALWDSRAPGPSAPTTATATAATATAATAAATSATAPAATAATAAPACCATMASLRVLAFDHEGRPVQFDTWLHDLQLFLLSHSKDSVSLFDFASGAAPAPPATADNATRSQWLTRDAAAHLAICNHLPLAECSHFGQHKTAQALYNAVVAPYSSPASAALGRLLQPYQFPELASTTPKWTLDYNTRFLEGCSPSPLAPSYASATAADVPGAEDVGVAFASAKRRSGKGKGSRGGGGGRGSGGGDSSAGSGGSGGGGSGLSGGGGGGVGGGGGGSGGSGDSGGGGTGGGGTGTRHGGSGGGHVNCLYVIRTGDRAGQTCGRLHTRHHCFSHLDDAWGAEFGDDVELPRWANLLRSRVAIFDLDFDAILSAMYALSASAKGDCYRCVPLDPGIAAAAQGASESGTLPCTVLAETLHTFTPDSRASRCFFRDNPTLTPLPAPVPVRLADPSGGPVVARSSTILPCPA
ncbi:unnamed protein product, partial [Closterium sp. NIES-54]